MFITKVVTNHSKKRTYFDSGDFALAAADRVTDNGAIQTGSAHPKGDSISHPYAPIPAAGNVDKDANEDLYRKSESPAQHTNIEGERDSNKKNSIVRTLIKTERSYLRSSRYGSLSFEYM